MLVKGKGRPIKRSIKERIQRHAIKHISRGNMTLAIRDILALEGGPEKMAICLAKYIRDTELKAIASPDSLITLRHYNLKKSFTSFTWQDLWIELQTMLPTFCTYLQFLLPTGKRETLIPAVCTVAGMVAKANNQQLNMVQDMLSIILYGGHTTTMVSIKLTIVKLHSLYPSPIIQL